MKMVTIANISSTSHERAKKKKKEEEEEEEVRKYTVCSITIKACALCCKS